MEIEIRERRLPGIGSAWQMPVGDHTVVMVMVLNRTGRVDLFIASRDKDEPECSVELSPAQAAALAGMLLGTRLVIEVERKRGEKRSA